MMMSKCVKFGVLVIAMAGMILLGGLTQASKATPDQSNAINSNMAHDAIAQGFVIVRCQGYFTWQGQRVYITGGIPPKALTQSQSAYGRMIQDGIDDNFRNAGTATYFRGQSGSVVTREIAVTDRTYSTWRWTRAREDDRAFEGGFALELASEGVERRDADGAEKGEKRYGGSATCEIKCSDGSCKTISCSVSYEYSSKTAAKNALKWKLRAKAQANDGKISGGISFDIDVEF